jgi:hypothetical protein
LSYAVAWIFGAASLGAVLLLVVLPGLALIGLVVVALGALAALVALAGAMLATPYLLVDSLRRRLAERRQTVARCRLRRTNDRKEITVNPPAPAADGREGRIGPKTPRNPSSVKSS